MASGRLTRELVLDPPARVRMLSEHASVVRIDKAIPVKRYLRSGAEMERQARVYYAEGQLDKAFMLYNKFATIFIEKLPKHPEYSKALPEDKARIKRLVKDALPRAMELKEKLRTKFEEEKAALLEKIEAEEEKRRAQEREMEEARQREEQRKAEELAAFLAGQTAASSSSVEVVEKDEVTTPSIGGGVASDEVGVAPGVTSDIAEDVVGTGMETVQEAGSSLTYGDVDEGQAASTAVWSATATHSDDTTEEDRSLTATNPALAQVLPPVQLNLPPPSAPPPTYDQAASQAGGDTVLSPGATQTFQPLLPPAQYQYQQQPGAQTPPTGHYSAPSFNYPYAPYQAPPTEQGSAYQSHTWLPTSYATAGGGYAQSPVAMDTSSNEGSPTIPIVDRSTKPAGSAHSLSTSIGGFGGYRPVKIPSDTAGRFEEVAAQNTRKNTETCGILAGKLSQDMLRVTHVIVPKQHGGPDSCETLNEEELFDVQDKYDLITLGWIHTHPTQTAFMSSVDLHTHCSYQIMMDEAVAIVCAPTKQQVGFYMLTEPHGLNYITHCEQEGFHTHPKEPPLYEECKHVEMDGSSYIQIVDLR